MSDPLPPPFEVEFEVQASLAAVLSPQDNSVYERGYPLGAMRRLDAMIFAATSAKFDFSIERWDNRKGWRLDSLSHHTPEQIAAAQAVLDAFEPWGESDGAAPPLADETPHQYIPTGRFGMELAPNQIETPATPDSDHAGRDEEAPSAAGDSAIGAGAESASSGAATPEEPIDAEFADFGETPALEGEDVSFPELEAPDLGEEIVAAEAEASSVAHMYGDSLHIMRWAKKGRLDEIARQRKREILGEWSASEFREQQAQLGRFALGELGAGPEALAHYERVANVVKAVETIDLYHESRVLALDTPDRAFIEAFDPEANWP